MVSPQSHRWFGALEHHYGATVRPWLDGKQWARLPAAFWRETLGRTV